MAGLQSKVTNFFSFLGLPRNNASPSPTMAHYPKRDITSHKGSKFWNMVGAFPSMRYPGPAEALYGFCLHADLSPYLPCPRLARWGTDKDPVVRSIAPPLEQLSHDEWTVYRNPQMSAPYVRYRTSYSGLEHCSSPDLPQTFVVLPLFHSGPAKRPCSVFRPV